MKATIKLELDVNSDDVLFVTEICRVTYQRFTRHKVQTMNGDLTINSVIIREVEVQK
jgi:hypothetical protein